jgi:hypothetical protein
MKDLLAGVAVFALWSQLGWSLVVGASPATKAQPEASLAACETCAEYGGTDYCECLAHPEVCQADSALYAQVWGSE